MKLDRACCLATQIRAGLGNARCNRALTLGTCGQRIHQILGESRMSGPRCDRMLAGTALALLLAAPLPPPGAPPRKEATDTDAVPPASPVAATEETPPPDPLASLDPADRPVAEKIRDLFAASATSDRIFASRNERAAVEAFYKGRNLAPLWLDKGIVNARAQAVIARLKLADADGLDVNDYRIPKF